MLARQGVPLPGNHLHSMVDLQSRAITSKSQQDSAPGSLRLTAIQSQQHPSPSRTLLKALNTNSGSSLKMRPDSVSRQKQLVFLSPRIHSINLENLEFPP